MLDGIVSDDVADQVRGAQIASVTRHTSTMAAANICNAAALVAAMWPTSLRAMALCWAAAVIVCIALIVGARNVRLRRHYRASPRAIGHAVRNAFVLGIVWGSMPVLMFAGSGPDARLMIACLAAGMMGGGAFALAAIPAAALAMFGPIAVGSILALAMAGGQNSLPIVGILAVYSTILAHTVFAHAFDTIKRAASKLEVQRLARRDGMTNLGNHAAMCEQIEIAEARRRGGDQGCALFLIDILRMRDVNRRHGYAAGDELLRQTADRLRGAIRDVDFAARLDGDHFAVLAVGLSGEATSRAYANRILAALEAPYELAAGPMSIAAVVGVALGGPGEPTSHLRNAHLALHSAKRRGDGAIVYYSQEEDETQRRRDALEVDLRKALQSGDGLRLNYQPFLDVATGAISGFEALLRWRHPRRGDVDPQDVVAIAEERGLMEALGHWVLHEACATAASWPAPMRVAVNVSPRQLRSAGLPNQVSAALVESGLEPSRLEIEITESALIEDLELARHVLTTLREAGVKVALDDFGTGYSSLNYLRGLPFNRLKIDRSFMAEAIADPAAAAIVRMILSLARELGMTTIAEGVEVEAQLRFLRENGCDEAQGYLIARAMAEGDVARFLEERMRPAA